MIILNTIAMVIGYVVVIGVITLVVLMKFNERRTNRAVDSVREH